MSRNKNLLDDAKRFLSSLKTKQWPSFSQWKHIGKILSQNEKRVIFLLFTLACCSTIYLGLAISSSGGEKLPAEGGVYIEGVIGHPQFINPIYASLSDVDRDLAELIFSGLTKYDKNGKIVMDLAKEYTVNEEGTIYEIFLKDDLAWEDGTPLTSDDIIFTVETIQDPEYNSPLRVNWLGITVEKISTKGIRFQLKNSYPAFLENLSLKILPKHIWHDIPAQNFPLVPTYNLKPVGSGPYCVEEITQDKIGYVKSLTLERNPYYHNQKPLIEKMVFVFFEKEEELIDAAKRGTINGFSLKTARDYPLFKKDFQDYYFVLPRYFAVFLNSGQSDILKNKTMRQALNYATNKEEIIDEVLSSAGTVVNSPILPEIYGLKVPEQYFAFDLEKAEELLDKTDFQRQEDGTRVNIIKKGSALTIDSDLKKGDRGKEVEKLQECLASDSAVYPEGKITGYFGNQTKQAVINFQEKYASEILDPWGFSKGTGLVARTTRKKLNELCGQVSTEDIPLKLTLVTVNQPQLIEVAEILKRQWGVVGIELEVQEMEYSSLEQDFLKPRSYESLLFGEVLGSIPDLFPFWHSSQIKDPGLNLSGYQSKQADQLLTEIRQSQDTDTRNEKLIALQDILIQDAPAVFLYSPDYVYLASKEVKGISAAMIIDPSKRFANIEEWYIKEK